MQTAKPFCNRWSPLVVCLGCGLLLAVPAAGAAEPDDDAARLKAQTERVVVFKDGYCLVVKRGSAVTDAAGEIHWTDVPDAAVLGSFWATSRDGGLLATVAGWAEVTRHEEKQLPCLETIEVLKANQGRQCSVTLPDKSLLTGTIQAVLAQETAVPVSDVLRPLLNVSSSHFSSIRAVAVAEAETPAADQRLDALSGTFFVLRTDEGDVLLSAAEIRRLTIEDMQTALPRTLTTKERTKRLVFRFAEPGQRRELLIVYFRPGLRWIPTYRVDLPEAGAAVQEARLAMQAELINEAEDLIDTPLDIVVGVPNFRFRSVPSPLVLERTMREALQQAAPQLMGQFRNDLSNALFTQRAGEFREGPRGAEEPAAIELPAELTAGGAQELYVYNLPKLSLRKGERAAIPVYTTQAACRNVYTWDLHVKRNDIATAPSGSATVSPLTLSQNQVWRQIVLSNASQMPWTTGAALIMQGGQPLAQELLTYTPPQGSCRVPVTVAVDVRGDFSTEEIERQLQALNWDGHQYAKIRQKAQLEVTSFKPQPIALEISVRFGGRAEQVSDDGQVALSPYREEDWDQYRGSPAVNNSSTVRWDVRLEPGQTFRPSVEYSFYARH